MSAFFSSFFLNAKSGEQKFIVIQPDRAQQLNVQARSTSLLSKWLNLLLNSEKTLKTVS